MAAAGAALLGAVLPWATVATVFGTISVAGTNGDGRFTVVLGIVIGVLALGGRTSRATGIPVIVLSAILTLAGMVDLGRVSDAAKSANNTGFAHASVGVGLYLTVAAGIAGIVAGILCHKSR
jgi:hypothetical protein